jgi:hypothetical protein
MILWGTGRQEIFYDTARDTSGDAGITFSGTHPYRPITGVPRALGRLFRTG